LIVAGLPYKAIYRVIGRDVVILNVVHTSRNWP
jgi:plasmid stabilization system protein ParE